MTAPADVRTCYRHPDRVAGIVCQRCDRPICPACMHQASVGFHCPECTRSGAQKVYRGPAALATQPLATQVLIAVNVAVFIGTIALRTSGGWSTGGAFLASRGFDGLSADGALFGPFVPQEPWRLLTSGFLHDGIFHVGLNMWVLWVLGKFLEPALGRVRFVALYFASLFAGALGVVLVDPRAVTVGASGAIFGLMGGAFLVARERGIDLRRSGLVTVLVINLVFTFAVPGISIGGHVGGLIGGAAAGALLVELPRRVRGRGDLVAVGATVVLGLACAVVAYTTMVSQFGSTLPG